MMRYLIAITLALVVIGGGFEMVSRQVKANTEVMLAAFGQTGILPPYRPPVVIPQATGDLVNGQIGIYTKEAYKIQAHIVQITAKPVGYMVTTITGEQVPKDDWLLEAQAYLDAINAHIAVLQAHQ